MVDVSRIDLCVGLVVAYRRGDEYQDQVDRGEATAQRRVCRILTPLFGKSSTVLDDFESLFNNIWQVVLPVCHDCSCQGVRETRIFYTRPILDPKQPQKSFGTTPEALSPCFARSLKPHNDDVAAKNPYDQTTRWLKGPFPTLFSTIHAFDA